jgi:hypothetical protein
MHVGHRESVLAYRDLQGARIGPWGTIGGRESSFRSGAVLLRLPLGNAWRLAEPLCPGFYVRTMVKCRTFAGKPKPARFPTRLVLIGDTLDPVDEALPGRQVPGIDPVIQLV